MLAVFASLSLLFTTAAAGPAEGVGVKPREPNPALLYWQGIALLPEMNKAREQLPLDVSGGRIKPDAREVQNFLTDAAPSLKRFRRAAGSSTPCEWGITLDEGPYAVMPHTLKMQWMGRLALLQAEHDFVTGKPRQAVEWILASQKAARHVGSDGLFMTVLMEYNMEGLALRVAGRYTGRMDSNLRAWYRQQLEQLPPLHDVGHALAGEREIAKWLHRMPLGFENQPNIDQAMAAYLDSLPKPAPATEAQQSKSGSRSQPQQNAETMRQWLEDWRKNHEAITTMFNEMDAASTKPWPEAIRELEQLQAAQSGSLPTVQNLFPLVRNYVRKRHEVDTQQRMLLAALSLGATPPLGNLDGWRDTFFNEPLVVKRQEGVLVIAMRQLVGNREISLRLSPLGSP